MNNAWEFDVSACCLTPKNLAQVECDVLFWCAAIIMFKRWSLCIRNMETQTIRYSTHDMIRLFVSRRTLAAHICEDPVRLAMIMMRISKPCVYCHDCVWRVCHARNANIETLKRSESEANGTNSHDNSKFISALFMLAFQAWSKSNAMRLSIAAVLLIRPLGDVCVCVWRSDETL